MISDLENIFEPSCTEDLNPASLRENRLKRINNFAKNMGGKYRTAINARIKYEKYLSGNGEDSKED